MKKILLYISVFFFSLYIISCEDDINGSSEKKDPVAVMTKAWNADEANVLLSGYVVSPGRNVTLVFEYDTVGDVLKKKVYADFVVKNDTAFLTASLGGLLKSKTYYVRVNAIKENGSFVSNVVTFNTTAFKTPIIKSIIKQNTASDSVNIVVTVNPSNNPTKVWLNYGTSKDALTQSTAVSPEYNGGIDVNPVISIKNLTASTYYYYQVVAENKGGQRLSDILRIRTNEGVVSDYDGKVYQTIKIGDQVWTASNWACIKYADGDTIDSCFVYKNDASKLNAYGRLYTYNALKLKNIAPPGWRVPTKDDWNKLIAHLGGEFEAGKYLKDKSFLSLSANVDFPDMYNFSSIPSGMRNTKGNYYHEKDPVVSTVSWYAYYWGLTDVGANEGFRVYMTYIYEGCYPGKAPSGNAYSLRLIKE